MAPIIVYIVFVWNNRKRDIRWESGENKVNLKWGEGVKKNEKQHYVKKNYNLSF